MKAILNQAVEESGVPVKAIADACDRQHGYMLDALNDARNQELAARDLVPFIRATNLTPLRWLCLEFGGVFDQLPDVSSLGTSVDSEALRALFMRLIQEVGQDSAAIERALADGQMTDSEGRDVVAELEDTAVVIRKAIAVALLLRGKKAPARMALPAPAADRRRA